MIHDMRPRGTPSRITKPLPTRRHITPNNTRRILHSTITTRVLRKIAFPKLITIIITSLLKRQSTHPRRYRLHRRLITTPAPSTLPAVPGARRGVGVMVRQIRFGNGVGRCGPRGAADWLGELVKFGVIEVVIIGVGIELEESVGIVSDVGLRCGVV